MTTHIRLLSLGLGVVRLLWAAGLGVAVSASAQTVTLVGSNALWNYMDAGANTDSTWTAPGFDDGAWLVGRAEGGVGHGIGSTAMSPIRKTYDLRHCFALTNPGQFRNLALRLIHNGGAIVYVNGVEVCRSLRPPGPMSYPDLATGAVTPNAVRRASLNPDLLSNGTNVVAVEMHQGAAIGEGLSFELELVGEYAETPAEPSVLVAGYLRREVYSNVVGATLAELFKEPRYPDHPDLTGLLNMFEAPSEFADNYGQRLSGFLLPPVTGDYVFYIASDDQGALFLSPDFEPAHKVQIAFESAWSMPRQWTGLGGGRTNSANISAPIHLESGHAYYIEGVMKENGGGDNFAVAWQLPGESPPENGSAPIPGLYQIGRAHV